MKPSEREAIRAKAKEWCDDNCIADPAAIEIISDDLPAVLAALEEQSKVIAEVVREMRNVAGDFYAPTKATMHAWIEKLATLLPKEDGE